MTLSVDDKPLPADQSAANTSAFLPDERDPAAPVRWLAEIAFVALLFVFASSPGAITNRHRVILALLALSLPVAAWLVYTRRASAVGWRLWLLFGAGFALSISVKGENLQRPPAISAAEACIAIGILGTLSLIATRRIHPTGFEGGLLAAILLIAGLLAALFHPVAVQNSLDTEVLHNTLGTLMDYALLLGGLIFISARRDSYSRMALLLSAACILRIIWRHAPPAS
ncbi:MAG TPA: hypothetical protein VFJ58_07705 [Armatimonadota bacterium]|nr:hypothetical protein [Armatimonadota bacterium]